MAQTTTNYGLYKPEATDTYNHLVYDNPNMDAIDAAMKNNADHGVDNASCIKSGTVHSVTRSNTSCPVFKFTATGDWNTGDTMNVDGTPVSVYLPNGTAPLTGCFVINTEVLAIIAGSRVTLMCPVIPDASNIEYDPTGTSLSSTNVEGAIGELDTAIGNLNGIVDVASWTELSATYGIYYTKVGKLVSVAITKYGAGINTNTDIVMGQLPAGFRPYNAFRQMGYNGNHRVEIAADGTVSVVGDAPNLLLNLTYIAAR